MLEGRILQSSIDWNNSTARLSALENSNNWTKGTNGRLGVLQYSRGKQYPGKPSTAPTLILLHMLSVPKYMMRMMVLCLGNNFCMQVNSACKWKDDGPLNNESVCAILHVVNCTNWFFVRLQAYLTKFICRTPSMLVYYTVLLSFS